jgi:hypothetical protein
MFSTGRFNISPQMFSFGATYEIRAQFRSEFTLSYRQIRYVTRFDNSLQHLRVHKGLKFEYIETSMCTVSTQMSYSYKF